MKIAVYPGSFDPVTNGHLDIIKRTLKVFDKVVVGVLVNPFKNALFSPTERVELIEKSVGDLKNIEIQCFEGLLIDFMKKNNSNIIVKGLRAMSDFEYEFQMALLNNKLDNNIETVFLTTSVEYSFLSSSAVKQVAIFGGCIEGLVPQEIISDVVKKIRRN